MDELVTKMFQCGFEVIEGVAYEVDDIYRSRPLGNVEEVAAFYFEGKCRSGDVCNMLCRLVDHLDREGLDNTEI